MPRVFSYICKLWRVATIRLLCCASQPIHVNHYSCCVQRRLQVMQCFCTCINKCKVDPLCRCTALATVGLKQLLYSVDSNIRLWCSQWDDDNPFVREYSLWAVRNLCEGNEEIQNSISRLRASGTVHSPELHAKGLQIKLDDVTGKP